MVCAREFHHAVAVFERRGGARFVRWIGGWDHEYPVKGEAFFRGLGYGDVSVMNWIESTSEDADPQR
jgi:hypothetical protein